MPAIGMPSGSPATPFVVADRSRRRHDLRQHRVAARRTARAARRSTRAFAMSNSERARCVRDVGRVDRAAGQPPQQERVDRAERELAGARLRGEPVDVRGASSWTFVPEKYGSSVSPVSSLDPRLLALRLQLGAALGGAAVLPDDRVVHGLAGLAVPQDRGLALVRDADRRDRRRRRFPSAPGRARRAPSVQMSSGSCSTQPGLRIDLAKLLVAAAAHGELLVEDEHGGAGGALIDRDHVAHGLSIAPGSVWRKNERTSSATMSRSTSLAIR